MCAVNANQIDSDAEYFTVELLQEWKSAAERNAFNALTSEKPSAPPIVIKLDLEPELLERSGLAKDEDIETLTARLQESARSDLDTFKVAPGWPSHAVALNLRTSRNGSSAFAVTACAAGIGACGEVSIVAPPGTGKSTTLVQLAEAILAVGGKVSFQPTS